MIAGSAFYASFKRAESEANNKGKSYLIFEGCGAFEIGTNLPQNPLIN